MPIDRETLRVAARGAQRPFHLFSAAPNLVSFGSHAYRRRSEKTSALLGQLFEGLQGEGFVMPYTMEDFERDYIKKHLAKLTPEDCREVLESLPTEKILAALSPEKIRQIRDHLGAEQPAQPRKPRRKR